MLAKRSWTPHLIRLLHFACPCPQDPHIVLFSGESYILYILGDIFHLGYIHSRDKDGLLQDSTQKVLQFTFEPESPDLLHIQGVAGKCILVLINRLNILHHQDYFCNPYNSYMLGNIYTSRKHVT